MRRLQRTLSQQQPVALGAPPFVPNDKLYGQQWHLDAIDASHAWPYSAGKQVRVRPGVWGVVVVFVWRGVSGTAVAAHGR